MRHILLRISPGRVRRELGLWMVLEIKVSWSVWGTLKRSMSSILDKRTCISFRYNDLYESMTYEEDDD